MPFMSEQLTLRGYGAPVQEIQPDPFEHYEGYEIDSYILARRHLLLFGSGSSGASAESLQSLRQLIYRRHTTLRLPKEDAAAGSDLFSKISDITDVWHDNYLSPRLAPLPQAVYLEWVAAWLDRSDVIKFDDDLRKSPWGAGRDRKLALLDIELEPLHGPKAVEIMIPPTVRAGYNDLGHSTLLCWTGEEPIVQDVVDTRIRLYKGMAEQLHMQYGVPLSRLPDTIFTDL